MPMPRSIAALQATELSRVVFDDPEPDDFVHILPEPLVQSISVLSGELQGLAQPIASGPFGDLPLGPG